MAVTFVGAGTPVNTATGGLAPPYPSGWAEGDLLIMVGFSRNDSREYTPMTGFAPVEYITHPSQEARLFWSWKIAAADDDTTPNFAAAGTSLSGEVSTAHIVAFRGAAVARPVPGVGWTSDGTSQNNGPVPGMTVPPSGASLLVGGKMDDYSSTPTTPSGWTFANAHESTLGSDASLASFYTLTAGDTGDVTYDHNPSANAHGVALMFTIAPPVTTGGGDVTDISGLVGRWRASDLALSDGGAVTSWPGTGAGGTLTGFGTTYAASSLINGHPAVSFDGVDDHIDNDSAALDAAVSDRTVGIVFAPRTTGSGLRELVEIEYSELIQSDDKFHWWVGGDGTTSSATHSANTPYVWTATASSSGTETGYQNGVSVFSQELDSPPAWDGRWMYVGAGSWGARYFDGHIAEICVWDHPLTTEERATWHTYVQDTYGIEVADYVEPVVSSDPYGDLITLGAPVAWWRGDGDVTDETGGTTGTATGATYAASPLPARPGAQAFSFDGIDDKVEIPDQPKLDPTGNFSLEAWFVADSIGGGYRNVAGKEDWILEFDGSGYLRFIRTGANGARIDTVLPTGVLHHAVAVVDTNQMRLYVNGALAGTAARPTFSDNSNPFRIGCWDGSSDWFDGVIGEVALYDRALSDAEISQHYTVGTTAPSTGPGPEGLAHWWRADSVTGVPDGGQVATVPPTAGSAELAHETASMRPTYREAGIGGKPALEFDGTEDHLWFPSYSQSAEATYVVVHQPRAGTDYGQIFHAGQQEMFWDQSDRMGIWSSGGGFTVTRPIAREAQVWTGRFNGASSDIYIDGEVVGSGTTGGAVADHPFTLGRYNTASRWYPGMIAEVLIYDRALTTSELAEVHSYIQDRYGITVADYTGDAGPEPTTVAPPLLGQAPSSHAPAVTPGAATASPPVAGQAAAPLTPSVQPGPIGVSTTSTLGQAPSSHAPTASPGGLTISPPVVGQVAAPLTPSVQPGPIGVSPLPVGQQPAAAAPTVQPGAVTASPPVVGSAPTSAAPAVTSGPASARPPLLGTPAVASAPTATPGPIGVSPPPLGGGPTATPPVVEVRAPTVHPPLLGSAPVASPPAATPGSIVVSPAAAGQAATLASPTVEASRDLALPVLGQAAALHAPAAAPGAVIVSPEVVGSEPELYLPKIEGIELVFAYTGTAWDPRVPKKWNGSAWVAAPVRVID